MKVDIEILIILHINIQRQTTTNIILQIKAFVAIKLTKPSVNCEMVWAFKRAADVTCHVLLYLSLRTGT